MREHEHEAAPGLPESLPAGEAVLWQGAPGWRAMARRTFHLRGLALYFAVLAAWRAAVLAAEGASVAEAALGAAWLLALGGAAVGLIALFAALSARTTLYTITDRRLVMRVGVALPVTVNIPFAAVQSAGLRRRAADPSGDIVLTLVPPHRASWVALWPHVRAFGLARPAPVLRALPDAEAAAQVLARALAASAAMPVPAAQPSAGAEVGRPAAAAAEPMAA